MYSENFHSEDDYNPPHRKKPNGMATASVILGIVALSSITFPLSAVIFGALSILCALLSRTDRMPKRSIAGLILSLVSIAGSSFMVWRTVSYLQKKSADACVLSGNGTFYFGRIWHVRRL